MQPVIPSEIKYRGRHLNLAQRDGWEYATRTTDQVVVAVVAITSDDAVVLVEQTRKPISERIIELPAGLVGDEAARKGEPPIDAAQRELLEETGYSASQWTELPAIYSSPGLTDEVIKFFLAEGLEKTGAGGGVPGEGISVIELPLGEVLEWFTRKDATLDAKLVVGICAAQAVRRRRMCP